MERFISRQVVSLSCLALLLVAAAYAADTTTGGDSSSSCTRTCGNISVPYPFGFGSESSSCYYPGFNLTCNSSYHPPRLFLGNGTTQKQVLEIFTGNSSLRINSSRIEFSSSDMGVINRNLEVTCPYALSSSNMLLLAGCDARVELRAGQKNNLIGSCTALCPSDDTGFTFRYLAGRDGRRCSSGVGCCEANIFLQTSSSYRFQIQNLNGSKKEPNRTGQVYLVDPEFDYNPGKLPEALPALLEWYIINNSSNCPLRDWSAPPPTAPECRSANSYCQRSFDDPGYRCRCSEGYTGNPYVPDGCIHIHNKSTQHLGLYIGLGIIGGIGLLLLAVGAPFISRKMKLHKVKRMRERFFKQNHGLLLQRLVSQHADIGERMIITLQQLERATDNFDKTREVGGGGHGIVYKGILDLRVVAIKKSRIVVQTEIDDFINEVAILSQVNHRNVVKLLGCCLEAEVPLLVYEFIPNGSLDNHLHIDGPISLPWVDRLRIALEVARALTYLHSATTIPIFHRDIKACNVLLDDNLIAKVSDFGASRYIPIDQTEVITAVQGTIGYLDPMYYYTGHLTDKSDVFSFGVLLIELLTRKKPMYRTDNGDSLVLHFASLLRQGQLVEIIDPQVMTEGGTEVQEVASLAEKCTKLNGQDRPTMREVEMTLENLQAKRKLASHSTESSRYGVSQIAEHRMLAIGDIEEISMEYDMEAETLLSEKYHR